MLWWGNTDEVFPMGEARIIRKIKRLLRQARMPRWLHHYGPKKYEFWQHILALLIKQECKLSFRRVHSLLTGLGIDVPTYSALCKMSRRMPVDIWQTLLHISADVKESLIAAVDGVYYSRTNPSFHYLKRIDREMPVKNPVQANVLLDTVRQKVIALRVRAKKAGEVRDAIPLLKRAACTVNVLVADKAFDAEYLHSYAREHDMLTMIPKRKTTRRGKNRKHMLRQFKKWIYNRRSLIESNNSSVKRKSGNSVQCKTWRTQNAELFARYAANNLNLVPKREIFN